MDKANSALLSQTNTEMTDFSLEPDTDNTDVSGWQLDLEGIQLGGWHQRLATYNKKRLSAQGLKSPFPAELSRSPVPGSRMWQSLYKVVFSKFYFRAITIHNF